MEDISTKWLGVKGDAGVFPKAQEGGDKDPPSLSMRGVPQQENPSHLCSQLPC